MLLKKVNSVLLTVVAVFITAVLGDALLSTFFRCIGILGRDRFRGAPYMWGIERFFLTFWLDMSDAVLIARWVVLPMALLLIVGSKLPRFIHWLVWTIMIALAYQIAVPGGWSELMGRKNRLVYLLLLLNGTICYFVYPLLKEAIPKGIKFLLENRVFEGVQ